MAGLSQKELLTYSEGIGSMLKGALNKTAQVAGGLAGVAGQTLLPKTKQLKDTLVGSFKTGAKQEAERQAKGGILGITGDMLKGKMGKLKKALQDQGYIYKKHTGNLAKQVSVEVGELMWDPKGKPIERPPDPENPEQKKLEPVVAKWDAVTDTYNVTRMGRKTTAATDREGVPYWHFTTKKDKEGAEGTEQNIQPAVTK